MHARSIFLILNLSTFVNRQHCAVIITARKLFALFRDHFFMNPPDHIFLCFANPLRKRAIPPVLSPFWGVVSICEKHFFCAWKPPNI